MAKKLTEVECLEFMLANYAKNIRKQGYCEQCQHPDYDGLCECGHGNEEIGNLFINIRLYIDSRRK